MISHFLKRQVPYWVAVLVAILGILAASFLIAAKQARAAPLQAQFNGSTLNTFDAGSSNSYHQRLGTALTGTVGSVWVHVKAHNGDGVARNLVVYVASFTDSAYTASDGYVCYMPYHSVAPGADFDGWFGGDCTAQAGYATLRSADYEEVVTGWASGSSVNFQAYGPTASDSCNWPQVKDGGGGDQSSTLNIHFNLDNSPANDQYTASCFKQSSQFGTGVEVGSTHIVDFTPEEGTTTGNSVTFALHVHINPTDLSNFIGVQLTYQNIDQNQIISNIPGISHDQTLFFGSATTSGEFYYTTTVTLPDGNYRVKAQIQRTLVGTFINPFAAINDTQYHQFVVNQETYIGHLNQNGFKEFNELLGSTTATSTAASSANCNPLGWVSASSTLPACLGFLFIPGGPQLDETVASFKTGVITRVPWGYFYRLYQIFSGVATSALPSYTVSLVTGPGSNLSTTTLTYDPNDMIAGAGSLLNSIKDPQYGLTVRDVFEPYVKLLIAAAVVIQIFADLTGSHRHDMGGRRRKPGRTSGLHITDYNRGIDYDL